MADNKHTISDDEYFKRLGQRIEKWRIDADFTSAESFAIENQINRSQYLKYEKGKNMELLTIRKIAAAHNKKVEELLKGLEDTNFKP
jgi:transcriptional regulator with XRE-family HTH domain